MSSPGDENFVRGTRTSSRRRFGVWIFCAAFFPIASVGAECTKFAELPAAVSRAFTLDVKKAQLEFLPITLGKHLAYVISNIEGCRITTGECDAQIYFYGPDGCYHEALTFRGKWRGILPGKDQDLSALRAAVERAGPLGKITTLYRFDSKLGTLVESGEKR